ncbi:hypothetical protein QFC19_002481 [Naganishia cerealis]|uniref:Uncharacterized protein n=1 Tax=Naganishia cerealis TaxID=610337 RepID=A0ACC2W920_9TREE|nr:hypothetical protein QFC19_002481 [Naganishia cerealis]
MARALENRSLPAASTSSNVAYDSDPAPQKESQHTLPPATSSDEQPNVKVSGGKRKKPEPARRGGTISVKSQVARMEQGDTSDEQAANTEIISDAERELKKSRRLMSPAEALLDSAQAVLPAPGLHRFSHSRNESTSTPSGAGVNARRQTTFTLRPPRENPADATNGVPIGDNARNRSRASLSPETAAHITPGAVLINRYVNGRRHRTSQSPGSTSTASHFHSFSAIVTTAGAAGMDTTMEEDESGDSGETSGASVSRQNLTSMSLSGLHDESSYEAMEREVQAGRASAAGTSLGNVDAGSRFQTPRQALFNPPQMASSHYTSETPNMARQPFFPILESRGDSQAPESAGTNRGKRRSSRKSADNQAYRPEGDNAPAHLNREGTLTDSADEDGGGEGLAAHLPERSTRGKRHEQGEGYLGTGLSFDPHTPGKPRSKKGDNRGGDGADAGDVKYESQDAAESQDQVIGSSNNARNSSRARVAKFTAPARSRKTASVSLSPAKDKRPVTANKGSAQSSVDLSNDVDIDGGSTRTTQHRYLSTLRSYAATSLLKWLGIFGGLLAVMWWLVSHTPPEVSEIGHHRASPGGGITVNKGWSRHVPQRTGTAGTDGEREEVTHAAMEDLLQRLRDLEANLILLSTETYTHKDERARSERELAIANSRMEQLNEDLRRERSKREQDRHDLDQLRTTIHTFRQQAEASSSSLSTSMDELSRKVDTLESGVREALSEQRMMQILERVLPSGVPVRRDLKTGEITIDPSFWTELRKVVAAKTEVESLSHRVATIKKKQESGGDPHTPVASAVITKVPTWQDFLDENEETLRVWAGKAFDRKLVDAQVIDRSSFLSMLKDELHALHATLRDEASSRDESTMAKVNKELEEIRAYRAAESVLNPVYNAGDVDTDIKPVLQRLIDDSLLKYSKDVLARPDYALASGGAHTVEAQTTKTLVLVRPQPKWPSWVSQNRDKSLEVTGRTPLVILHPATQPGMCWPFEGSQGHVGISLSREIHVTDVTVEHVAKELVSARSLMSAPRDMELWATFGDDQADKVRDFLDTSPYVRSLCLLPDRQV